MAYSSNTKAQREKLQRLKILVAGGAVSDALVAGLKAGTAAMMNRIFNRSLDATGRTLGPYFDDSWIRHRKREGRQVAVKDLEVEGSLRRSIEVVSINNTRAEVRFTDTDSADIGRYQEQQIYNLNNDLPAGEAAGKIPIFEFNETEIQITQSTTRALIQQRFNSLP